MDDVMIATHFENIDRRLDRIEQVLPTLATKEDLGIARLATEEDLGVAIAPLASKEELRIAIAPLATKDELHALRRHMDVLFETLRADIQLLAEHLASVMPRRQN